jgi:ABC-type multidrug transport system ATPase subunit
MVVDEPGELVARGLVVELPNGRRLLESVDLHLGRGRLTAIVGPSGSGKSTLLNALAGIRPASTGVVEYDGRDLFACFDHLRHRIGHVPQDEVLHLQLPLGRALSYTARLRNATSDRVDEVLDELGLTERADVTIGRLSGGQQQRASVGLELLTRPTMLFLDEPTAGLDPGYERSVMRTLRGLADGGRTVLVVTHAVASLDICDTVVFLAPGGKLAYVGPPAGALGWFGAVDYPDVFIELEERGDEWSVRWLASDLWAASPARPQDPAGGERIDDADTRESLPRRRGSQLVTLSRRTADVLMSTKGHFRLLLLQAPVIAVLLLVAVGFDNLASEGPGRRPRIVLAVLMLGAVTMGLVNACREIVRELAVYRRERTVGLSLAAYLGSKFVVLGALAFVQTLVLVSVVVSAQDGPEQSVLISPPMLELGVIVFLTALASVAMGLAVSAWVTTDAAALVLIPVLLIGQLVLSDSIIPVEEKPGLGQLAWVSPSYWGFRAEAASTHMLEHETICQLRELVDQRGNPAEQAGFESLFGQAPCRGGWEATEDNVAGAGAALIGLTAGFAALAALGLRRRDPRRP